MDGDGVMEGQAMKDNVLEKKAEESDESDENVGGGVNNMKNKCY